MKSKIFIVIKNICFYLLIILFISIICFSYINKNRPLSVGGYYFFIILSGSMSNTLNIGDCIIVKETNDYGVGDIITYKKDDYYVTHRIVKIDGDYITTRGDANSSDDTPFNKNMVIGRFISKSIILNFIIKYKISIALFIIVICIISVIIKELKKKVNSDV